MLLYAPLAVAVILVQGPRLGPAELLFMLGSGALHLGYFLLLQRGYSVGDLSQVYPLARGTGPLLATAAALAFLGERPTAVAICGVVLIAGGVFLLTRAPGEPGALGSGTFYGLLTGVLIAAYTLWDRQAVGVLLIPPLLFDWSANVVRVVLLTPLAIGRRKEVLEIWRARKPETVGVAVLSPLSYILFLTALAFTPVSYVAPAREIGILIGAAMGARLLAEGHTPQRSVAAVAMFAGVGALALG